MIQSLFSSLGPWAWIIIGLALLAAETVLPGVYLIWFGAAGLTTGLISLGMWNQPFWTWQAQGLIFALFSVAYVLLARRYLKTGNDHSDQPLLNKREASLIGRTSTLTEAISDGFGRVKIDDSIWRVTGPDLEAGSRVVVTGANGQILTVELAPQTAP